MGEAKGRRTRRRLPLHGVSIVRRIAALFVLCVLLVSCRVDATVDVEVAEDGSGVVRVAVALDADAATRVPDVRAALPTDDLSAAGWTVSPTDTAADGTVTVRAEKPLAAPEHLPVVLSEVSSAFRRFELERGRSFGKVTWKLTGEVDLTGGAEAFGDDQLAALLGGRPIGRDVASLEQEIGTSLADATSLGLRVALPGGTTEQWTFRLDQPAAAPVAAESTVTRSSVLLWSLVAIAAAGLFVLLLLVWVLRARRRRRVRRRRRTRATRRADRRAGGAASGDSVFGDTTEGDRSRTGDGARSGTGAGRSSGRRLELVIAATHGVMWEPHSIAERWIVGLLEMQGVRAPVEDVRAITREARLGRIGTADVWRALGAEGDPDELDAAFVSRFTLDPQVVELVTIMGRRGIGVAAVSDDAAEWSSLLRRRFGLESFVDPWVVSAEVGALTPSPAMLEEVVRRAGVPPTNCMVLDADLAGLEAAKRLGMVTVLIGPSSAGAAGRGHRHAADLSELLARRSGSVRT